MRCLLIAGLFISLNSFSQGYGKVWTEIGAKGKFSKKLEWGLEWTNRFGSNGLETSFPQATIKYKVTKWFKPSVDYRAIFSRQKNTNYDFSNRLNFNAEFKHTIDRLQGSLRLRYQYSFDHISSQSYDVEFDQAFRIKPQISYDINDFLLSPTTSIEFFYDPTFSKLGRRFTKYRLQIGADLDLNSAHEISIGYILDQQINLPAPETKHILSLSYTYNFGFEEEED